MTVATGAVGLSPRVRLIIRLRDMRPAPAPETTARLHLHVSPIGSLVGLLGPVTAERWHILCG